MIRVIHRPLTHVINVKGLGAAGDGVANDTGPLQAALDMARDTGGGTVYVPPGTYKITSTLRIYSRTRLELHPKATILRGSTINAMLLNGTGNVSGYNGDSDIEVVGGVWDANNTAFPATQVTAIAFGHAKRITIRDLTVKNVHDWHCVELNAVQDAKVINCQFLDMTFTRNTEMIQLDLMLGTAQFPWFGDYDKTPCQNVLIQGCVFRNGPRGVGTHSATAGYTQENVTIAECYFENMAQEAVYMYDWSRVVVKGCQFKDCWRGVDAYPAANDVSDFVITDNTFYNIAKDSQARAIRIGGAAGVPRLRNGVIKGNVIDTVARYGIGVDYNEKWTVVGNMVTGCQCAGIWVYRARDVCVLGNVAYSNGLGTTDTSTEMDYDINIGDRNASSTADAANVVCANNNVETLGIWKCQDVIVTGNNIKTRLHDAGLAVNVRKVNNMIAGVWTP